MSRRLVALTAGLLTVLSTFGAVGTLGSTMFDAAPAGAEGPWFAVEPGTALEHGRLLASYEGFDLIEARSRMDAFVLASQGSAPADYLKRIGFLQGDFDPLAGVPEVPLGFRAVNLNADPDSASVHVIQFRGPVLPGWKADLGGRVEILDYIPHSAYIVRADPAAIAGLVAQPQVRWAGVYQPWYKVEPALHDEIVAGDRSRVLVDVRASASQAEIREIAALLEIERVELSPFHVAVIGELRSDRLPAVARHDAVAWVQSYRDGEILNGNAQWVVQSGQSSQRPVWDKGLHGEGQLIGYADTGLDYDHVFFRDASNPIGPNHRKVIGYQRWAQQEGDANGHGSHVAGSLAGDDKPLGGTSGNVGQAYAAKLFVDDVSDNSAASDWSTPSDLATLYIGSYNAGARVHSNSWGFPNQNTYNNAAVTTDRFAWDHKDDYLIVYGIGNERSSGQIRSPGGTAKNIVSVGATQNGASANDMASFSSVGPSADGRMKPTVCAPGAGIMSADSDGNLNSNNAGELSMSGTSMATPTTAGSLALIRQYFTEGWYPTGTKDSADAFVPTAALMKATLLAGAVEITGTGSDYKNEGAYPNNSQGWGRINLDGSLYFAGDSNRLAIWEEKTGLNTGETRSYSFDVSSTSQMLRVTIVWTDYPGATNANPALVNDLDIEVTDPDGVKYLANNFAGKNPGHSVTGGQADRRNNEEGVLIPTTGFGLKSGRWAVVVRGNNVPQGPQPFAIAVSGDVRGGGTGSSISRVAVSPANATITADQTRQFTATAFDVNGNQTNATFTWNTTGGSVSATGLFTPSTRGTFQVSAKAGTKVGIANVTVIAGAPVLVIVNPPNATVGSGGTQQFSAVGRDAKGNQAIIQVNWSSSIGGIDAAGVFTAPAALGTGTVTATEKVGGVKGTATVNVIAGPVASLDIEPKAATVAADQTLQFMAKGLDQNGNPTTANPTWSVSSGTISATGLFTPDKIGVQTVTARENGITASEQVTVTAGKIIYIIVEPAFVSITADETTKLVARGQDAKANTVVIAPAWTATIGAIAGDGTYTPDKIGVATVTATLSGVSGVGKVEVRPGRIVGLEIVPGQATITADDTLPLEARGLDSKGNPVTLTGSVEWNAEKGTMSTSGAKSIYRPREAGQWKVTATASGATGEAVATVTPGRMSSVKVTPETVELLNGDSTKFVAHPLDVNGNEIMDASVVWEVTDRVGTITEDGTFTATRAGDGKVVAEVSKDGDEMSGQASVSVTPLPPLEAYFRMVGGQMNGLLLFAIIIALVVGAALASVVSRRRRREREAALRPFAQNMPGGSSGVNAPPAGAAAGPTSYGFSQTAQTAQAPLFHTPDPGSPSQHSPLSQTPPLEPPTQQAPPLQAPPPEGPASGTSDAQSPLPRSESADTPPAHVPPPQASPEDPASGSPTPPTPSREPRPPEY